MRSNIYPGATDTGAIKPKKPRTRVKKTAVIPDATPASTPASTPMTAASIATATAATLTTTLSTLQSHVLNPIIGFFSYDRVAEEENKKGRRRFAYEKNITASLSLQLIKTKESSATRSTTEMFSALKSGAFYLGSSVVSSGVSLINSASSLLTTQAAARQAASAAAPAPKAAASRAPVEEKPVPEDPVVTETLKLQEKFDEIMATIESKTAAKQLTATEEKKYQAELEKILLAQISLVEALIKEHAARRVDLFFYLLVAVYNQKLEVQKGNTELQHGSGSAVTGTHACHSSLFPNPELTLKPSTYNTYMRRTLSLQGTHFLHSLNMTTQLNKIVNEFDGYVESRRLPSGAFVESKYTKAALVILNKAAMGEIDPEQGLNQFINLMKDFFKDQYESYIKPESKTRALASGTYQIEYSAAYAKVWELQKRGTFAACKSSFALISFDSFLDSVLEEKELRIDPAYFNLMEGNSRLADKLKNQLTPNFFRFNALQTQIFETKEELPARKTPKP